MDILLNNITNEPGINLNVNFDKVMTPELAALLFYLTVFIITIIIYYQLYILEFVVSRTYRLVSYAIVRRPQPHSDPEENV